MPSAPSRAFRHSFPWRRARPPARAPVPRSRVRPRGEDDVLARVLGQPRGKGRASLPAPTITVVMVMESSLVSGRGPPARRGRRTACVSCWVRGAGQLQHKAPVAVGGDLVADFAVGADAADVGHEHPRLAGHVGAQVPGVRRWGTASSSATSLTWSTQASSASAVGLDRLEPVARAGRRCSRRSSRRAARSTTTMLVSTDGLPGPVIDEQVGEPGDARPR